ncbi:helicase-associated domain-containing protein [Microbacterium sp. H1-D42]|uniref:helicase-associated domain-containing protein n=1 Tax=Microbacterium sp. H1-D42 TaxID=2925844 RepID=UPI001F53B687|nr:helicase-associated domain-containing protein [Microbacterium sp. H1-D42]UNK71806.1 helicase-associated domain-containing protein [Microbacterium sp. H1-D42]
MSTHARPLADRLAAASDAQLEQLLRIRRVRADVDWTDFFDAAEALLEPSSIERGLESLTQDEARALQRAAAEDSDAGADAPPALTDFTLMDDAGDVPTPVAALVRSRPVVPDAMDAPMRPASEVATARAAERAFTTIGDLADVLLATRSAPLALVATGALSATERRRFTVSGSLDDLRALAEMAGLARPVDRELRATDAAEQWLSASFAPRWAQVTTAFRDALPQGLRTADGWLPAAQWPGAHPWDRSWPAAAAQLRSLAMRLGLFTEDDAEPEWASALRAAGSADAAAVDTSSLEALLPTEVDRVFLQNDLSAIAPGPLRPALDNRLRAMTEHESAVQASSYRFTADSVARALVEGETERGILEFLHEVSLTGVPQPLEYLVAQTATRHGLVRVGPDSSGGTIVSSVDDHLLGAIEIDRNLRPMGLVRDGDRLTSRVGAQAVAWALTDARYPATLVDLDGDAVSAARTRVAPHGTAEPVSYAPLIGRLRARQGPDADAAWLDRELEAAVRARALVVVEVGMPDGSSRELTLEASGVGGGRLRGRDRAADVERTLPVRSIRSVRVLES